MRAEASYSGGYQRYVTTVLLIVYVFNQTDRAVFGFVMEPIKQEFGLSDTQMGFLAGPAFVMLYALLGIPVARLADRHNRVNIISIAVALWSVIVALSAMVANFWHFVAARIGVGLGEAGFTAVAQSVVSDYHSAAQRTRAISLFMLAIPLGGVFSSLLAGWVNESFGWRAVFLAAGLPGIALAFLVKGTVREPARQRGIEEQGREPAAPTLWSVVAVLGKRRTLMHMAAAMALINMVYACTFSAWIPVFFVRVHGMTTGEVGTWLAFVFGGGGCAGIWLGGYLTTRYGAHDPRIQLWLTGLATVLIAPLIALTLWAPSRQLALLSLFPVYVLVLFSFGPVCSMVLGVCAASMRATMASIFIFIQQVVGILIGVQLTGILSDVMTPLMGSAAEGLRWAMTIAVPLALWAAIHFWLAGRALDDESPALEQDMPPPVASNV